MKQKKSTLLFASLSISLQIYGQGTFVYDQQSTNLIEGIAPLNLVYQPMGQAFTPSLSTVGFVDLNLYDAGSLPIGATVIVNLRSGSVTGTLLGTSSSVTMANNFFGVAHFLFTTPVSVIPETTYYFQPVVVTGDGWQSYVTDGSYTRGFQILSGLPVAGQNLWFREGIIVPEPSATLLILVGSGALIYARRKQEF